MDRTDRNKDKPSRTESHQNPPSRITNRRGARNQVYFVRCGEFVKIGFASHVPTRFSGIKTSTPHEIELLGTVPGTRETEAAFHERFKRHHHRGEWFCYHPEIEAIVADVTGHRRPANKAEVARALEDPYMVALKRSEANRPHLEEMRRREQRMQRAKEKRLARESQRQENRRRPHHFGSHPLHRVQG